MRITNNMMSNSLMWNLQRNLNTMSKRQDQLATGKQVIAVSDDPIAASKILKFKTDLSELDQFSRNTTDALSWMEVTESSISDTGKVLQRMRELAVQAANGTNTAQETQQIEKEVAQLKEHIIRNGNFNFAGRYVFSGSHTDQPLFNDDGTYNVEFTAEDLVSPQKSRYQIGVGERIDVSTNGLDVYGFVAPAGGFAPEQYLASGATTDAVPPAGSVAGVASTKAELRGGAAGGLPFPLNVNYTVAANSLDITVDGTTYAVNELAYALDGTSLDLSNATAVADFKSRLLEAVRSGTNAGVELSTVADVYFDESDNLVVKHKSFGAHTITEASGAWDATSTAGIAATLPVLTDTTKVIPGAIPAAMADELRSTPLYLTFNGEQQRIAIDPLAVLNTPADYQTALQTAIDTAFGAGNITVGEAGGVISFTGNVTEDGQVPSLGIEHIVTKESTLITDINDFITALHINDKTGISTFLSEIDVHMNRILSVQADIGARTNRMDLASERINENNISYTKMLSDAQDADMAEVIMYLKNAENVYKASLSTGAKAIQPSLVDFLR